jgi:antitoxin HicB
MFYYAKIVPDDNGVLIATFPDCHGCQTCSDTMGEVIDAATEALDGWLEAHLACGNVPPKPSSPASLIGMHIIRVSRDLSQRLHKKWEDVESAQQIVVTMVEQTVWATAFAVFTLQELNFYQKHGKDSDSVSGYSCAEQADEVLRKFREAAHHEDACDLDAHKIGLFKGAAKP